MLKELALRPLEVLECPLPLNGAILHSNDLPGKPGNRFGYLRGVRDRGAASFTLYQQIP